MERNLASIRKIEEIQPHDSEFTWKVISNEFILKGGN